jgi:membrane peptidoglycan carboxypeptidase
MARRPAWHRSSPCVRTAPWWRWSAVATIAEANSTARFTRFVRPGSAFKLFVYFAALRKGYRSGDAIDAGPVEVDGCKPENFGGEQYGAMPLADAFAKSINTASARLALHVGLDQVIAAARDLGIDAPLTSFSSVAKGTNSSKGPSATQ